MYSWAFFYFYWISIFIFSFCMLSSFEAMSLSRRFSCSIWDYWLQFLVTRSRFWPWTRSLSRSFCLSSSISDRCCMLSLFLTSMITYCLLFEETSSLILLIFFLFASCFSFILPFCSWSLSNCIWRLFWFSRSLYSSMDWYRKASSRLARSSMFLYWPPIWPLAPPAGLIPNSYCCYNNMFFSISDCSSYWRSRKHSSI